MESPRKFNDCYFYYYSTCTKGDNCVFRHEPSALGCETMCTAWQQGKCLDKRCKLRHMELRKNRKQIPCYWENQPGGCRKMHCPFMHKNPDARTDGIAPSQPAPPLPAGGVGGVGVGVGGVGVGVGVGVGGVGVGVGPGHMGEPLCDHPALGPAPAPAPVPLLWQQQRQVVLESGILGVLPGSELVGRRVVAEPAPYPLPVDPLVVNFEEGWFTLARFVGSRCILMIQAVFIVGVLYAELAAARLHRSVELYHVAAALVKQVYCLK